jgi:hypothetical protein
MVLLRRNCHEGEDMFGVIAPGRLRCGCGGVDS